MAFCELQSNGSTELLARIDGVASELFLDSKDLIELSQAFRTGGSTSLDLSSPQANNDISNGDILSLTGSMGDHDAPASSIRVFGRLDGLGQSSNLVDLEEQGVARLEFNGLFDAKRIGDGQVVPRKS